MAASNLDRGVIEPACSHTGVEDGALEAYFAVAAYPGGHYIEVVGIETRVFGLGVSLHRVS